MRVVSQNSKGGLMLNGYTAYTTHSVNSTVDSTYSEMRVQHYFRKRIFQYVLYYSGRFTNIVLKLIRKNKEKKKYIKKLYNNTPNV